MAAPKRKPRTVTLSLPPIPKRGSASRASVAEGIRGLGDVLRETMYDYAASLDEGDSEEPQ